jgi:hypothetical protein
MARLLGVAVAALAFVSTGSASAQTFASTPGIYTFLGSPIVVQKGNGPVLHCFLSIDIINIGGVITAENARLTGYFGLCDTVVLSGDPWPVRVSGPTYIIGDSLSSPSWVYVDTAITPGDCMGTVPAVYDITYPADSLVINFGFSTSPIPSTLPQVAGGGDCKIDGVITWP